MLFLDLQARGRLWPKSRKEVGKSPSSVFSKCSDGVVRQQPGDLRKDGLPVRPRADSCPLHGTVVPTGLDSLVTLAEGMHSSILRLWREMENPSVVLGVHSIMMLATHGALKPKERKGKTCA